MLMHHDFAGVKKPKLGWARIIQRPASNGYYGYDIDAEDFCVQQLVAGIRHLRPSTTSRR